MKMTHQRRFPILCGLLSLFFVIFIGNWMITPNKDHLWSDGGNCYTIKHCTNVLATHFHSLISKIFEKKTDDDVHYEGSFNAINKIRDSLRLTMSDLQTKKKKITQVVNKTIQTLRLRFNRVHNNSSTNGNNNNINNNNDKEKLPLNMNQETKSKGQKGFSENIYQYHPFFQKLMMDRNSNKNIISRSNLRFGYACIIPEQLMETENKKTSDQNNEYCQQTVNDKVLARRNVEKNFDKENCPNDDNQHNLLQNNGDKNCVNDNNENCQSKKVDFVYYTRGMIFQVSSLDDKFFTKDQERSRHESMTNDDDSKSKEKVDLAIEPPQTHQLSYCSEKNFATRTNIASLNSIDQNGEKQFNSYQLIEKVYDELGLTDFHSLDYAYRPVSMIAESTNIIFNDGIDSLSSLKQFNTWFQGFNSNDDNDDNDDNYHDAEKDYERMDDHAFAGGSQGEVWRARRRCNQLIKYTKVDDGSKIMMSTDDPYEGRKKSANCDASQMLIMKRLKVEKGFLLLEAGMREIYFGKLLLQQQKVMSDSEGSFLFTKYVDHFFLQPSNNFDDSEMTDLWIVFEDAGPSLRSHIYTPVSTGDYLVYQHSLFWRHLRLDIASVPTYSSSVALQLSEKNNKPRPKSKQYYSKSEDPSKENINLSPKNITNEHYEDIVNDSIHGTRSERRDDNTTNSDQYDYDQNTILLGGKYLLKKIIHQILTSASCLHKQGIVHRDIKPSNIMCQIEDKQDETTEFKEDDDDPHRHHNERRGRFKNHNFHDINCVLGDFSSAINEHTSLNMYSNGPSVAEQTNEYAPPEVLLERGKNWYPFYPKKIESYDSWSIGVVILELLLGTPNVFSVDQRTTSLLTNKMRKKGASDEEIQRALYLAALSQFCIYMPTDDNIRHQRQQQYTRKKEWPLRDGDPLHNVAIVKTTCTIEDFHTALRARDPLGLGFDSDLDSLLNLVWGLLAWNPEKRLTPAEALHHYYFDTSVQRDQSTSMMKTTATSEEDDSTSNTDPELIYAGDHNAIELVLLDPRMNPSDHRNEIAEFTCPKCGKKFHDVNSCIRHATSRRHSLLCDYDTNLIPPCLNAHSMLPAHPTSGYCDIQGRRQTIEDFHTVHLHEKHQFYGVFDGHNGNLASKFAASSFYKVLVKHLAFVDDKIKDEKRHPNWRDEVAHNMRDSFHVLNHEITLAIARNPGGVMGKSGTTATSVFVTEQAIVIANVGDSRAILSVGASYHSSSFRKSNRLSFVQLTVDHVATNQTERERIEERGGFVSYVGGTARVNGTLAVTRSLGDVHLSSLLSRTPHVVVMSRAEMKETCQHQEEEDSSLLMMPCFIVLASDGLWDVISNQEAVEIVQHVIQKFESKHDDISWADGGAFQNSAEVLTREAYVRGSTDNIGVCVVAII